MDTIEKLKIFCMAAESLSFIAVAKQLDLPRSTITYAIKALEKEYEVRLFNRTTRQVTLTNEGQIFFEDANLLLQGIQTLNRFKHPATHAQGYISIGLPLRLASQIVIPNLPLFQQQYPNVKIRLNTHDGFSNLINEQLDCVLRIGGTAEDYLIAKTIANTELLTLASPSYLKQHGQPQCLEDLKQHIAVGYSAASTQNNHALFVFAEHRMHLQSMCTVADTESYLQCGLNGLGLIQIPAIDAKQYIDQHTMVMLLPEVPPVKLPIQLITTSKKYRPQYCQDFLLWLETMVLQNHK